MRRIEQESAAVPPAELINYALWCAGQDVRPFGVPGDPVSMRAAVAQLHVWEQRRREWAAAHGVDAVDMGLEGAQPWDESAI